MRQLGNMQPDLAMIRTKGTMHRDIEGWSIAIYRQEDDYLLGHAILFRSLWRHAKRWTKPEAQFYVRHDFRRQGIGRRLGKHVRKVADEHGWTDVEVMGWNAQSKAFFESLVNDDKLVLEIDSSYYDESRG